MGHLDWYYS